ncbi:DUF935 domain-containing protein [Sporomusa sphaeroides DSM 2875]|uniref:DUF935 domain-containing protein n=1 Tax=Sporomusa sphaeroides TaxID=47679 RepID=UPI0020301A5F|nr:DUF935 domain-containing protein [Sporomusa sphaeroides]MCM0757358.1 DUF935 domain-containing protein [Sporomusa sphaeroides DSM 2875]
MPILDQYGNPIQPGTARPDLREVAAVSIRDRYSSYPSNGLNPQRLARILREADDGDIYRQMELFEEMEEKDAHLFSQMQIRKNAVLGKEWEILPYSSEPADVNIAKFVGDILYNLTDLDDAFLDLLDGIGKGYATSEIMWDIRDGKAVPVELKWRHQKKFTFDQLDNLRLITDEAPVNGIEIPANKFAIHRYKARSGHPSRAGVYRVCAWMYLFKNYTIKDWVAFAEVYGMPLRVGKYDTGAPAAEKEALMQAVMQLGVDAAAIISKNTEIQFVEAVKNSGGDNLYKVLAEFCNGEMSKAILGNTLTSDTGSGSGSYALGKVHGDVRQDILEGDCKSLAKTVGRDIIRPIVLFNFGPAAVTRLPYLKHHYEPPEDTKQAAEVYKTLAETGLPIGTEHAYEKFGIPKPEPGKEVLIPWAQRYPPMQPMVNKCHMIPFEAPQQLPPVIAGQRSVDYLADQTLAAGLPIMTALMAPILKLLQEASTLEELEDKLIAAYPDMDTGELEDLLARAMFVADLYGRVSANG